MLLVQGPACGLPYAACSSSEGRVGSGPRGSILRRVLVGERRPPVFSFVVRGHAWAAGKAFGGFVGLQSACAYAGRCIGEAEGSLVLQTTGLRQRSSEVRIVIRGRGHNMPVGRGGRLARRGSVIAAVSLRSVPPKRWSLREKAPSSGCFPPPKRWEVRSGRSRAGPLGVHEIRVRVLDIGRHFSALPVSGVDLRR